MASVVSFPAPSLEIGSGALAAAYGTARVRLRRMGHGDVERIYEANRNLNRRYLSAPPLDRDGIEELHRVFEQEWRRFGLGYMMVCRDDEVVGHARLKHLSDCASGRAAELTYAIAAEHRGHGFATEAVGLILRFAFEEADVDYVVACIEPENLASVRVAEKNGFALVATGRMYGRLMRRYILPASMWRAQRRAIARRPPPAPADR